ncbi:MAG: SAM-dependent methyltransferase, partial [Dongiaceae bacterium]
DTLAELRQALMEAELAETGGASPRVSPFADLRDAGGLLQRASFALPVVDGDRLTVRYPDLLGLMRDLRGMGEANAVQARPRRFVPRTLFARADHLYRRMADADGRLPASFQIITMTAWAPHAAQQQALAPGSARTRLADALGIDEQKGQQ